MLPWCLFEYKQAATSEEGLCVIAFCPPIHLSCGTHAYYSEKLACELLLIQQNMEVMLHLLGVQAEDDLGDLRLPFAVAAHLGPDGCRFMALSPNENERGFRPCICLARVPWNDYNCILTGFAHIVVRFSPVCHLLVLTVVLLQECGKRFWSTVKAAVGLNRKPLSLPHFEQHLDALPIEVVRIEAADDEVDTHDGDYTDE